MLQRFGHLSRTTGEFHYTIMTTEEFINLCKCGESSTVQYKEEFSTEKKMAEEMVAFSNSRGGIILLGVKDKTGELIGLSYKDIQEYSRQLGNTANEQVKPAIYVNTESVTVEDKNFLVCYIKEGKGKPYKTNDGSIWVKQSSDKRKVTDNNEILSLFQNVGVYQADSDTIPETDISDLEMAYVNDFFDKVYKQPKESFDKPVESLLQSLSIIGKNSNLTRAGLLFFGKNPQLHEHTFVIKAVNFIGNDISGSEYRDSRDITGTIPQMFRDGMSFLKSNLHHLQNGQNFNRPGILEIPEVVLEELLQNALVHIDLLLPAYIRLLIFDNRVEIINPGSLFGGLTIEDILLGISKQRNPLLADFCSKTMIYRGLGSGIRRALKENVKIDFKCEGDQFKAIIWRTNEGTQNEKLVENDEELVVNLVVKGRKLVVKVGRNDMWLVEKLQKLVEKAEKLGVNITANRIEILKMIMSNSTITIMEMAQKLGISSTAIDNNLDVLRDKLIRRVGSDKSGTWEIIL